jgi:hypothetical protein
MGREGKTHAHTPRLLCIRKVNGLPIPHGEDAARENEAEVLGRGSRKLREGGHPSEGEVKTHLPGDVGVGGFGTDAPASCQHRADAAQSRKRGKERSGAYQTQASAPDNCSSTDGE